MDRLHHIGMVVVVTNGGYALPGLLQASPAIGDAASPSAAKRQARRIPEKWLGWQGGCG